MMTNAQSTPSRADIVHAAPSGTFFENLEAEDDGSVLFTSYFAKTILRWSPADGVTTFATLNVHPVSFVSGADKGLTVFAHGAPFVSGPDFVRTMQIVKVDAKGHVAATFPVTDARFLNGSARLNDETILIADSLAGVVWSYGTGSSAVTPFLADPVLAPVAQKPGDFALGANGIKLHEGFLYVSNSSTTSLHRVAITNGKPSGPIELVKTLHGIDDFAIDGRGRIFVATHRTDVVMIDGKGQVNVLTDRDAEGATAVAFGRGPSAGSLFVTTTGGMFAGLKATANLLRLPIPQ